MKAKSPGKERDRLHKAVHPAWEAAKVALPYLLISLLWILLSGRLSDMLARSEAAYRMIETYKGAFFIAVTAAMLFAVIYYITRRLRQHQERLDELVGLRTEELEKAKAAAEQAVSEKDGLLARMMHLRSFDTLLMGLSQDFINARVEDIDRELADALGHIGEYLGEERIFCAEYDWVSRRMLVTAQWNRGVASISDERMLLPFEPLREMIDAHSRGERYFVPDAEAVREETGLVAALRAEGIRSFISLPIVSEDTPLGFIGISAFSGIRTWDQDDLTVLGVFSEMLKNVYVRRRREEELDASRERIKLIINAAADAIVLMTRGGTILSANTAAGLRAGRDPDEMLGMNISALLPPEPASHLIETVGEVICSGVPVEFSTWLEGIYTENSIYPAKYVGENGVVAVFSADVTKRVEYEREIVRSRNLFKGLVDSAPVGIYWKGADGKYLGCNRVLTDSLDTTPQDMIGKDNLWVMSGEDAELSTLQDREIIASGEPKMNQLQRIVTRTGRQRLFNISKVPLRGGDGEIYGLLGVADDITDRREKEVELVRAKQDANAANRAKSAFLSRMSHEIRSPLNSIIGLTHIAQSSQDMGRIKEYLERVDISSRHLLSIINDILDLSRIEAGKMSVSVVEFDLSAAVEETVGMILPRADEKKQRVDLFLEDGLPHFVKGDPVRFRQVLMNLLTNAVKFTPDGGKITVRAQMVRRIGMQSIIRFTVEDRGIGIDEAHLTRIFEPFEQADVTSTREFEGTGLGLAISKNIVELMGGEIAVESRVGEGSRFWFSLPFDISSERPAALDIAFEDLNVLVVDDEEETCAYMESLLRQYRIRVTSVHSGEEAIERIRKAREEGDSFHVAFIDWRMPGIDGIRAAQEIRKITGSDTVVIMFSMCDWNEIEPQAKEAGISFFLPKPIFPSRLLNVLCQITGGPKPKTSGSETQYENAFAGKRLLVVEDIHVNQLIIRELLAKTGAEITQAFDGKQALELFNDPSSGFDAILMDIQMPVMDGLESTRHIRSSGKAGADRVPIIAMTANVFKEDVDKAMLAGMDAHVAKPIDAEDLMAKLKTALH